jgi:hypothetical protein
MIYTLNNHVMILQLSAGHRLTIKTLRNNCAKFYDASLAVALLAENYWTAYVPGKIDRTASRTASRPVRKFFDWTESSTSALGTG